MSARRKEQDKLLHHIEEQGCVVTKTTNGHLKVQCPNGSIVMLPSTPGEGRSDKNSLAYLRRAGLDIPRKGR